MTDHHRKSPGACATEPTICFVIPYFGKWPFWFPFFLESCRANPSIDWLLHTDCGIPGNTPANVKIVETTFASYCQRVSDALGIAFEPTNPYKLCDLKPALGYIHRDELGAFDFWAFGDIDLVYGNLRSYFTANRLSRYDVYSTHKRRISGHCCLLRNIPLMREAFMHVPHWKRLLSSPEHVAFDEGAFSRLFIRHKNWPEWLANLAKPLHFWPRRTENIEAFSTPYAGLRWIDGSDRFPSTWHWDNGRLTNDQDGDRQFPYFHFMVWKQREWLQNGAAGRISHAALAASGRWRISADGFSEGA
ncbi:MAG: hypothetical protein QMB52_05640 [Propionivibrio sp.]